MHRTAAKRQNDLMQDGRQILAELGKRLKDERTRRGITLPQVADATKITVRHLEAIEQGDYSGMPANVYMRGFVRSYAKYLELDESETLKPLDEAGILSHTVPVPVSRAQASEGGGVGKTRGGAPRLIVNSRVMIAAAVVLAGGGLLGLGVRGLWMLMRSTGEKLSSPSPFNTVSEDANVVPVRPAVKRKPVPAVLPQVAVSVTALEECWIEYQTDMKRPEETVLKAGESRILAGTSRVRLLIGNAGGVRVSGPGGPVRIPEKPGRVVHLLFTPEGMEKLKLPRVSATLL